MESESRQERLNKLRAKKLVVSTGSNRDALVDHTNHVSSSSNGNSLSRTTLVTPSNDSLPSSPTSAPGSPTSPISPDDRRMRLLRLRSRVKAVSPVELLKSPEEAPLGSKPAVSISEAIIEVPSFEVEASYGGWEVPLSTGSSSGRNATNPDLHLPLPPGWRQIIDGASLRTFYVHEETGAESIVHPFHLQEAPQFEEKARQLLAQGWECYIDTGRYNMPFYYNSRTGETSWYLPIASSTSILPFRNVPILPQTPFNKKHLVITQQQQLDTTSKAAVSSVARMDFQLTEEIAFLLASLPRDTNGESLWKTLNQLPLPFHPEVRVERGLYGWKANRTSPYWHLSVKCSSITGPCTVLHFSLLGNNGRLSDDFVLEAKKVPQQAFFFNMKQTEEIQLCILAFHQASLIGSHLLLLNQKLGCSVDSEISIGPVTVTLSCAFHHSLPKEESTLDFSTLPFILVLPVEQSPSDLILPKSRDQIQISIDLTGFIGQATSQQQSLPPSFIVEAGIYADNGTVLDRKVIQRYPESFKNFSVLLNLPSPLSRKAKNYILFRFLQPLNQSKIPSSGTGDSTVHDSFGDAFAFAYIMLHKEESRKLRSGTFNVTVYEGSPQKSEDSSKKDALIGNDLTTECRKKHKEPEQKTFPSSIAAKSPLGKLSLAITLKAVMHTALGDPILQDLLDNATTTQRHLKSIKDSNGDLLRQANRIEMIKHQQHIIDKIATFSRLPEFKQEQHLLWQMFTTIVVCMSHPEVVYPLVHAKCHASIRDSLENETFLKDYLNWMELKLKQLQSTQTDFDSTFGEISFSISYLLGPLLESGGNLYMDAEFVRLRLEALLERMTEVSPKENSRILLDSIMLNLQLLYPYCLSSIKVGSFCEILERILSGVPSIERLPQSTILAILGLLGHIYQYDAHSKWKKEEMFVQCHLLHWTFNFMHAVFRSQLVQNVGVLLGCGQLCAFLCLEFVPSLYHHSRTTQSLDVQFWTGTVNLLHWLLGELWNLLPVLIGLPKDSTPFTVVVMLCTTSLFDILCSEEGKLLRQITALRSIACNTFYEVCNYWCDAMRLPVLRSAKLFHEAVLQWQEVQSRALRVGYEQFLSPSTLSAQDIHMIASYCRYLLTIVVSRPSNEQEKSLQEVNHILQNLAECGPKLQENRCAVEQAIQQTTWNLMRVSLGLSTQTTLQLSPTLLGCWRLLLIVNALSNSAQHGVKMKTLHNGGLLCLTEESEDVAVPLQALSRSLTAYLMEKGDYKVVQQKTVTAGAIIQQFQRLVKKLEATVKDFKLVQQFQEALSKPRESGKDEPTISPEDEERWSTGLLALATNFYRVSKEKALTYLQLLSDLHRAQGKKNLKELASTLVYRFDVMEEIGFPDSKCAEAESMLVEAFNFFTETASWEGCVSACERLVQFHTLRTKNYKKAAEFSRKSAEARKKYQSPARTHQLFHGGYYYGTDVPLSMDGRMFIHQLEPGEHFKAFIERIKTQMPNTSVLLPKQRFPNYKPPSVIRFIPVHQAFELDPFIPISAFEKAASQTESCFVAYLSVDDIISNKEEQKSMLSAWNTNKFVPKYTLNTDQFPIEESIRNSSSLPPEEPPFFRVSLYVNRVSGFVGSTKRAKVARQLQTMIPGEEACLEWMTLQLANLQKLRTTLKIVNKAKAEQAELWCVSCKTRVSKDKEELPEVGEAATVQDSHQILKAVLTELMSIESNYTTGIWKARQIIEKNHIREEKMHEKIKQDLAKAWVRETKICKEKNLPAPPKPNVDSLTIVTNPLIVSLKTKLQELFQELEACLVLHQQLAGTSENEVAAHDELEILYHSARKL